MHSGIVISTSRPQSQTVVNLLSLFLQENNDIIILNIYLYFDVMRKI